MWRRKSGCAIGSGEDGLTQARALHLQPVEEPPRPDEFRGQHTQREKNRERAGTRSDDHDHADGKQREAEDDSKDSLGLLERLDDHLFVDFLSDWIALLIRDSGR